MKEITHHGERFIHIDYRRFEGIIQATENHKKYSQCALTSSDHII